MLFRPFLFLLALMPTSLVAGPVTLTTLDGSLTLEGELLDYDGEFFRVETAFGEITMDGGNVRCSGEGCPDPDKLVARARIGGPPDMIHRLMPSLLEVFADQQGLSYLRVFEDDNTVRWELSDPETTRLIAVFEGAVVADEEALVQLASRDFDIALGRTEAGRNVRQDVIALDALVPIVGPDNPRAMVTFDQLSGLLSGRLERWSRLGGEDVPVNLHLPVGLESLVARLYPSGSFAEAVRYDDLDALVSAVAADSASLGLVPYSMIGNAVPLIVGGACGLAIPATRGSIRAEDYPVTQPLFLHRIGARQPKLVRDFIAFARSHDAQPLVRAAGFVDQALGRIAFDSQGDRIANAVLTAGDESAAIETVRDMIGTLMAAERLTLSFRFRDGSSELDPQSASNIQRLADAIGRGEFDERELMFVGFSDGTGEADGNLRLSERRARSVRQAVASRVIDEPVRLTSTAFGEAMPMACDDTPWGRQVNRRVEVWVR